MMKIYCEPCKGSGRVTHVMSLGEGIRGIGQSRTCQCLQCDGKGYTESPETQRLIELGKAVEKRDTQMDLVITPAYQSYFSAGDESEVLCPACNCNLDEWDVESKQYKYCPECGQHIKTYDDMINAYYKAKAEQESK